MLRCFHFITFNELNGWVNVSGLLTHSFGTLHCIQLPSFIRFVSYYSLHSRHISSINSFVSLNECKLTEIDRSLAHTVLHSINPAQFNHCVNVIEWRIEFTSLTRIAFSYHSIQLQSIRVIIAAHYLHVFHYVHYLHFIADNRYIPALITVLL